MFKFGTGGWRAIIGDEFTRANINLLAQSLSNLMKKESANTIVIGHDRRFLSLSASQWTSEVFAANGIEVLFIENEAPTPLIMFGVKTLGVKYGIAVTASHNPAEYNGIKVFTKGGRDASEEVTKKIEQEGENCGHIQRIDFAEGIKKGIIKKYNPHNEYIDSILSMIDIAKIRNRNLKVLLDPMFGVSKTSLQTILLTCRCEVDIINDRHDTLFGGRLPSPSAATLTRLKDMVVEKGYDIGIGTDGDADRIGVIDSKGRFIHPNEILILLYYYLIKYKEWKGDAVRNVCTTHMLDKIAENCGFACYEVPVGFKHISDKMEKTEALVGGESSGGLTIRGHIKGKDGIFAAALLIEMICVTGKDLSAILDEINNVYGTSCSIENNESFSNQIKEKLMNKLFEKRELPLFSYEVDKLSYLDGLKVYFKNQGWIAVRFSGTEPLLRIFCEMPDKNMAEKVQKEMYDFLEL